MSENILINFCYFVLCVWRAKCIELLFWKYFFLRKKDCWRQNKQREMSVAIGGIVLKLRLWLELEKVAINYFNYRPNYKMPNHKKLHLIWARFYC